MITTITGPMFSGKTEKLLSIYNKTGYRNKHRLVFSPSRNTRDKKMLRSRNGLEVEAIVINNIEEIKKYVGNYIIDNNIKDLTKLVVFIDEAQFIENLSSLVNYFGLFLNVNFVISGLDLDANCNTFGDMGNILAISQKIYKLSAVCNICKEDAYFTQRLINGVVDRSDRIIIEGEDNVTYEARCFHCKE